MSVEGAFQRSEERFYTSAISSKSQSVCLVLHAEIGAVCADLSVSGELKLAEEYQGDN